MVTNHGKSAKALTKKIPLNETITLRRTWTTHSWSLHRVLVDIVHLVLKTVPMCCPAIIMPCSSHFGFSNAFYYYLNRWIQVTNAVDHVKSGTNALQTAKTLQRKSRKCMMIAIILLLVIAIIIVLSILKPWNKGKWTCICSLFLTNFPVYTIIHTETNKITTITLCNGFFLSFSI